jgi:hypothetical protein
MLPATVPSSCDPRSGQRRSRKALEASIRSEADLTLLLGPPERPASARAIADRPIEAHEAA